MEKSAYWTVVSRGSFTRGLVIGAIKRFLENWFSLPEVSQEVRDEWNAELSRKIARIQSMSYADAKEQAFAHLADPSVFQIVEAQPQSELPEMPLQLKELFTQFPHFFAIGSDIDVDSSRACLLNDKRRFDPSAAELGREFILVGETPGKPRNGQLILRLSDGTVQGMSDDYRLSDFGEGWNSVFHWILSQESNSGDDDEVD